MRSNWGIVAMVVLIVALLLTVLAFSGCPKKQPEIEEPMMMEEPPVPEPGMEEPVPPEGAEEAPEEEAPEGEAVEEAPEGEVEAPEGGPAEVPPAEPE
ncbi:MAG: hypothetical protein ACP5KN_06505 [Armatimonadota bacterium]